MKNYIVYKVKKQDTKDSIAMNFGVSVSSIITSNSTLLAGDRVIINLDHPKTHIVKPGETLASIATKYNTTELELKQKNNINRLFVGQQLYI